MLNILNFETINFVEKTISTLKKEILLSRLIFSFLNIFNGLLTATTGILTALVLSHEIWGDGYPEWYFFVTSAFSAFAILSTSFLNFFLIKDKINTKKKQLILVEAEEVKFKNRYESSTSKEKALYKLYIKVASIMGNISAKKEVEHG